MVLDPHTHAWGAPSYDHPWVNGIHATLLKEFSVDVLYTAERLLEDMDDLGVDETVVVGYPIYDWTDNSYLVEAVERYDRLAGIAMFDAFADDAAGVLREHMAVDGMLGIRLGAMFPRSHEEMWWDFDGGVAWLPDAVAEEAVWEAARETDTVVQILAHHGQLDQVLEFVEAYPDLTYLVDHWGMFEPGDAPGEGSAAAFGDLADHGTVAMKVSSAPMISDREFPYADLHDHLRWLLDAFGRDRIVWGSDFPNVSHPEFGGATYAEALDWLKYVDGLSTADRRWITERSFDAHVDR